MVAAATRPQRAPGWTPSKRQGVFLARTEYEVLYGGAKMGGKTDVLLMWCILRRIMYPGSRGLFIRRQTAELTRQGAAWDRIQKMLGNRVAYNQTAHTVTFPNGSIIEFNHCKDEGDKYHYHGSQYHDICFDQVEQFTETMYTFICMACRVPQDDSMPRNNKDVPIEARIRASANPGDVGHAWVKERFVDTVAPETTYSYTEEIPLPDGEGTLSVTRTRCYVPSLLFDNPYAPPEYALTLYQMPAYQRDAYLYGKWDVFVGQAFPEFKRVNKDGQPHHVIPTAPVPDHWRRAEGHDWGYASMCYTCWGAIKPDGGIVIYKEKAVRRMSPQEIARTIIQVRGVDNVPVMWAGHDIFQEHRARLSQQQEENLDNKGQLGASILDQYRNAGLVSVQVCQNLDRLARKQRYHELLDVRPDGQPWLQIMDCCPILIQTLQLIQADPERIEDVVSDYQPEAELRDDPYDGCGHMLMSIPTSQLLVYRQYGELPGTTKEAIATW